MDEELMGLEEIEEGVNEQPEESTAEAAPEDTGEQAEAVDEAGAESAEQPAPEDTQDAYTNAQFAAARRRAEAEFQERLQREKDNLIRETYAGQVNPYTGKPITNEADLNEYKRQAQEEQLKQAGLDPKVLHEIVENNPAVKQARELTARLQQQEGEIALSREMQEIAKLDPAVKSVADLMTHPSAQAFNGYVQRAAL